ncbi:MAG TPA: hypothetical protein VGK14_04505 [Novimethylophilus sp.]|jgi:hypothetical protein|uniref:hypothetical protein n=1 Tax=Novimethylophilus sp. TaxID=2137426 RepID=UPI002F405D49
MEVTSKDASRIARALFLLRVGVFIVMAVWTLDKFIRPEHTAAVFEHFYGLEGLGTALVYTLASAETALLIAFVLGVAPRLTYGVVLLLHGVSTLSAYQQYLHPFDSNNLLFFAAWPMLAACFALYTLRDFDTWRITRCLRAT